MVVLAEQQRRPVKIDPAVPGEIDKVALLFPSVEDAEECFAARDNAATEDYRARQAAKDAESFGDVLRAVGRREKADTSTRSALAVCAQEATATLRDGTQVLISTRQHVAGRTAFKITTKEGHRGWVDGARVYVRPEHRLNL